MRKRTKVGSNRPRPARYAEEWMTRAILFDLGGVIVPLDFARGYQAIAGLCPLAPEEIPKQIRASGLVARFETGEMGNEEFVEGLCQTLGLKLSYDGFCDVWSSIFLPHTLVPEALIESLGQHHRLVLLSNTNAIHFDWIRERYSLLNHFHEFVLSYRVGAAKPSAKIYREAVERAGCPPEECFFTDDVEAYVEGARAVGIDATRFHSHQQLVVELNQRGIEL